MTVRSAELGHSGALSGAGVNLFTVASGTTVILKTLSIVNSAGAAAAALLFVTRGGTDFNVWRRDIPSTGGGGFDQAFHVFEPGDVVKLAGTSSMSAWASGAILLGVA